VSARHFGPSDWRQAGHRTICCDDRIEQRLRSRLESGGYAGIHGVASWMGWPDNSTYAEREADYLAEEIATLDEVLTDLERNPSSELILDTTGSVIYTGNNLLRRLRRQMSIVYLVASAEEQQLLMQRYLGDPKPVFVAWRVSAEKGRDTARNSRPLLSHAHRRTPSSYEALAHCTLAVAEFRDASSDPAVFLSKVSARLERAK